MNTENDNKLTNPAEASTVIAPALRVSTGSPPPFKLRAHSDGCETCGLHRRTPYAIFNVSKTQLSIARFYGGIKFQGDNYIYFPDTDELVREDVLNFLKKSNFKDVARDGNKSQPK